MIRVTAVRMSEGYNDLEHITHVRWQDTVSYETNDCRREDFADWIDKGNSAYVQSGSNVSKVTTFPLKGRKFLRTAPNNTTRDNLLSLPRF